VSNTPPRKILIIYFSLTLQYIIASFFSQSFRITLSFTHRKFYGIESVKARIALNITLMLLGNKRIAIKETTEVIGMFYDFRQNEVMK